MTNASVSGRSILSARQPWLSSPRWDLLFIISPAFVSTLMALSVAAFLPETKQMPLWVWVSLVLVVDVAHVYATLFRTYLNRSAMERHKGLLITIPALCWAGGSLLYSLDALLFWRALAYLAVFHFIRQQYGFVCLYSRKDPASVRKFACIDHLLVYIATLYPLLYWHSNLPRNFSWFVDGDFLDNLPQVVSDAGLIMYGAISTIYLVKEFYSLLQTKRFNIPKNLLIAGTAISWWVGIVSLNSDVSFTLTNVLTHGIPYMGLIWLYHGESPDMKNVDRDDDAIPEDPVTSEKNKHCPVLTVNKAEHQSHAAAGCRPMVNPRNQAMHGDEVSHPASNVDHASHAGSTIEVDARASGRSDAGGSVTCGFVKTKLLQHLTSFAPAYVLFLITLAYLEEGFWDGFIWREHLAFFAPFSVLPELTDQTILTILVPGLALPQSTHYVLDGFIWRVKNRTSLWSA